VEDASVYTMQTLARTAEANDEDTGNHGVRAVEYAAALAEHLRVPEKFVQIIRIQAQGHDIGKLHVPWISGRKRVRVPKLNGFIMKSHTTSGGKILGDHPRLIMAKKTALTHRERWFGSGYPHDFKGEKIPLEGRITILADQYDALSNVRPYKLAFDHQTTYKIITQGDGRPMPSHFDPQILQGFKAMASRFEGIFETLTQKG
jgi:HD-GYP domain-containing protein (c-di-GMP phosphodiesterase class II)